MRAILIDPENKTLSEIQISDSDAEHMAILQCDPDDGLSRGAELNCDETGKDLLIGGDYYAAAQWGSGPGFILDDGDDRDIIRRRVLALRFDESEPEVVADLQISIEELTKRITFVTATQERK